MTRAQKTGLCGSLISGRYQIIKSIGQGGMAHVYLASDQKTGRDVAIKVMNDDLSNDLDSIKRFKTEARITSGLNHPNIVQVIGFGQDHKHRYIVQEYVDGGSLKELINVNGAIPWQQAVPIAVQIGLALSHAHAHGLVHRDIKPHNILINKDLFAKVTDFGIAQLMTSSTITLVSEISFGSVHYASPEQARGTIMGEKSDIYSLGILMYEMVTGRVPFESDTPVAIAIKHLQEIAPSPSLINSTVPPGLDQIIMKCIQKSPDNRYPNARELVDELDAFMIDPNGVYGIVPGLTDRDEQTTALQAISPEPKYYKLREIEHIINKRRQSRRRDTVIVMAMILIAIVFMTSIGVWGWSKLSELSDSIQTEPDPSYELSNYVGRELAEVLATLEHDNILVDIVYSENPTVIVGLITAQKPSSGVIIKKTNNTLKLTLTVSSGPDLQVIPDLSGQSSDIARTELSQILGYKVTIETENAQVDQGKVIRTIPAAGQRLPQGSNIILFVSNGMPLVTMPDFAGQSLTIVNLQILALNLVSGPTTSISGKVKEANRIVIRQSMPAGSEVMEQSVISFTYGTAQDYANFRNPRPKSTQKPATQLPTLVPTPSLAPTPTLAPLLMPTPAPTFTPTPAPTLTPTLTAKPTPTPVPTSKPAPTLAPTRAPTLAPTLAPTRTPTATPAPTAAPTTAPTTESTTAPTTAPTTESTAAPTTEPTVA